MLKRVTTVDIPKEKLTRFGLFLSEDNVEKAKLLVGKPDDASDSEDIDKFLDNISEEEVFENAEFQRTMMEKTRLLKDIIDQLLFAVNENAKL